MRAACLAFALLSAELAPALAQQEPDRDPGIRITPVVGYAPGFVRAEQRVIDVDGQVVRGGFDTEFAAGPAAGLLIEIRSTGALRLTTGALMIDRASAEERATAVTAIAVRPGHRQLLVRAALGLRFHEANSAQQVHALNASVFVGPAYALEVPGRDAVAGRRAAPLGSWAINAGADAEIPLGRAAAVQLGVEDFIVSWDRVELERRVDTQLSQAGATARSRVYADASHVWLVRIGLTFRWGP